MGYTIWDYVNALIGTVIVDEADCFFIDLARSSARIAIASHENIAWVYHPILTFIKNPMVNALPSSSIVPLLREFLLQHIPTQHHMQINAFSNRRLKKWLDSAKTAWCDKKEDTDYCVQPIKSPAQQTTSEIQKEIVIVDFKNTGRLNEGSQWQNGIHQFLQAKHDLPIKPELLTAAAIDHRSFFSLYQEIIGLTGTMGEETERDEIKATYGLDSFDVPPHLPSKRTTLPPQVEADEKAQYEALLKLIQQMQHAGRPILILFETIAASNKFKDYLEQHQLKPQLLNETQRESEEYIIGRAGEAGMITIATNTAGRGADAKLSPQSKEAGGLHVVFTFHPNNQRVEDQGKGRSGRQMDEGSCSIILNEEENPHLQRAKPFPLNTEAKIGYLNLLRTKFTQLESEQRILTLQKETLLFEKQQQFFDQLKSLFDLIKEDDFKKLFIEQCVNTQNNCGNEFSSYSGTSPWSTVRDPAATWLQQQNEGQPAEWSYFYAQFTDAYLEQVKTIWAQWNCELQDDLDEEKLSSTSSAIHKKIDAAYEHVQKRLNPYLSSPRENFISCLKQVLNSVQLEQHHQVMSAASL